MVHFQVNSVQSKEKLKVIITNLDIVHCLVIYLKHDILEAGFGLHLKVKPTQLALINRDSVTVQFYYPTFPLLLT
jgi:hypothetical protein